MSDHFGGEVIVVEPDPRAELAELRAQVRYLADDLEIPRDKFDWTIEEVAKRLRSLVGRWPHEHEDEEDCDFGETWADTT